MSALHYLISTLFSLYTVVLLLRLILQLVRADFRNPLSRAIVQITNPVVLPLRKVLPPAGRTSTLPAPSSSSKASAGTCAFQMRVLRQ